MRRVDLLQIVIYFFVLLLLKEQKVPLGEPSVHRQRDFLSLKGKGLSPYSRFVSLSLTSFAMETKRL